MWFSFLVWFHRKIRPTELLVELSWVVAIFMTKFVLGQYLELGIRDLGFGIHYLGIIIWNPLFGIRYLESVIWDQNKHPLGTAYFLCDFFLHIFLLVGSK